MSDPAPEIDVDLLLRARRGDEAAFGQIMRMYYDRTFRLVYAIVRSEADARDVCQEVWLTVWKKIGEFRGYSKFSTWIHPIATRKSLDHLRKRRRWLDRFLPFATAGDETEGPAVPEISSGDADALEQMEGGEMIRRVRTAIDELPPKHRAVLALRELEGLTYEEIAQATGTPVGTVMSRLFHARRLLAERLRGPAPD